MVSQAVRRAALGWATTRPGATTRNPTRRLASQPTLAVLTCAAVVAAIGGDISSQIFQSFQSVFLL